MLKRLLLAGVFINIRAVASSVQFCKKDEVLHVPEDVGVAENSTSVCVNASAIAGEDVFSKCCPLDYTYDVRAHSCKADSNSQFQNYLYYEIGLRRCEDAVVVDYVATTKDFEVVDGKAVLKQGLTFGKGDYCVDEVHSNPQEVVVRACRKDAVGSCGDDGMKCLRKCCPDLEIYVNGPYCEPSVDHVFEYKNWSKGSDAVDGDFAIIHGLSCKKYIAKENVQYNIDEWGNLNLLQLNAWRHYKPYEDMYCIEHVQHQKPTLTGDKLFLCLNPPLQKYNYTRIAMSISCVFIFLTIISYVWLLENCNVFSKAVISYCVSLLITFSLLTYVQFSPLTSKSVCTALALATTGFMLSTFVWMNALCIDIWSTFGSDSALMTMKGEWEDRKRFLLYSIYGWGLPTVIVSLIALFKHSSFLPDSLQPLLGDAKCVMYSRQGNYSKLVFFDFPIAALKICDIVLFIRTSMHCMEVKSAITNMKDNGPCDWKRRFLVDKERLTLLIKLFIIMGIPWLFEVLSSIIRFDLHPTLIAIESVWDVLNCLQGVYIFIVFVCKRKVLDLLLKKTKLRKRKLSLSSAVTQSSVLVSRHCSGKR